MSYDLIDLPSLSFEVVRQCNIKCEGCNHFTNLKSTKHILSLEEINDNLFEWGKILNPAVFRILGGEPFINKNLDDVIVNISTLFPLSKINICTNGLLISNFSDDFAQKLSCLKKNIRISVSLHSLDSSHMGKIAESRLKLEYWQKKYNIKYSIHDCISNWTWPYRLIDNKIYPFEDNNQRNSWENCRDQQCKQIYKSKLYKCPLTAYMQDVVDKMDDSFKKYLNYIPANAYDSYESIEEFVNKEDEFVCGACPINPKKFIKKIK